MATNVTLKRVSNTDGTTDELHPSTSWGQIDANTIPDDFNPSSHTHGNITNGGEINTNTLIATGDRLVFADSSESNDLNASYITFDTSNTTQFLRKDGTFATPAGVDNYVNITGDTMTGNLTISNTLPTITFTDTNHNSDFNIANNNGVFTVGDTTNQLDRFRIYSSGDIEITGSSVDISGVTLLNDNGTLKWDGDKVETEEFASSYTAIASNGWNDYALGRGIFSRSNSSGLPSGGTHGYWLTLGRRDVLGGYAGIYVNDYSTSGSGVYIGRNDSGGNPTWEKVWTDKTDGSGSGLDADLLDGVNSTSFVRSDATDYYDRLLQSSTGVPTNNLGSPSITEMALFQEQFNNKTAFYTISNLKFYTSSDGTNWTEYTSFSDTDKRKFLGGDNNSGIVIPNLTDYFRIELTNNGNYVFLNALYMYWSSNSHNTTVKIRKQRGDGVWSQHTNSSATVSSWPGHLYLPFSTIAFHPSTTSTSHYRTIHIDFEPNWSGHATYGSYNINLYRMQIWGGYPAGKQTIYSVDEYKRVIFPEDVRIGGDSKRLDLARGTTSSQPKIIVGEQGTYGLQLRWDSGTKAHFDRFWSTSIDGTPSSQMMTFDIQNDRIGIGTTSPRQKLDVIGKIQISNGLTLRDNSIEQHLTNGNANVAVNYYGYANGHSQFRDFDIYNGKGGLIARFDGSSSNVGIGTTSPASPLHAYKNTSSGSNVISLETLNNKWDFRIGNSGEFLLRDGSYDRLTINNSNGNATFANDLTVQGDLYVNGSFTTIDTDTTTTEQWSVTNDGTGPAVIINQTGAQPIMDVQDDGTSAFYIADGGKVGIGTTTPLTTGGAHLLTLYASGARGMIMGASNDDALYIRRVNAVGEYQLQTKNASGNGGEIHLQPYGGNVGVGTTSPSEKLHIAGDVQIDGSGGTIGGSTLANGWLKIGSTLSMDNNEIYFGTQGYIGTTTANDLLFMHNSSEKAKVVSGGFDVSGNITVSGTVDGVDIAALNSTVATKAPLASPAFTGDVTMSGSLEIAGDLEVVGNTIGFVDNNFDARIEVSDSNPNGTGAVFNFYGDGVSRNATLSAEQFDGNASTASSAAKWTTARTITLGGDLTGNVSLDGSANVTLTAAVSDDSHNHTIANVSGLQTALDDKAEVTYTSGGTTSDVSTLNFSLSGSTLTITTS